MALDPLQLSMWMCEALSSRAPLVLTWSDPRFSELVSGCYIRDYTIANISMVVEHEAGGSKLFHESRDTVDRLLITV